jgi:nitrate/TMAO reductase-like tetraheme cytochrome c subunit
MTKRQQNGIGKIRAIIIVLFLCVASYGFFYPPETSKTLSFNIEPTATPKPKTDAQPKKAKYSEFSHSLSRHGKLDCSSCHKFPSANWKSVRKEAEAFPDVTDYPKHESCLNCHRQQFFTTAKPVICSICHTNPVPKNSARHPFPNPREIFDLSPKGKRAISDFAISFPHDKHIEIVSQNEIPDGAMVNASFTRKRKGEESCSVCHQTFQPQGKSDDEFVTKPPDKLGDGFWLKKGTFKTVPLGHATCFTCHSAETGILPAPTNCATCHKLAPVETPTDFDAKLAAMIGGLDKITVTSWRKRNSSATFRHEFSSHADLECASCHNVTSINTIDFLTKKVPIVSCNMCHITETSDDGGILNYEIDSRKKDASFACAKCHIAFGKLPIPESHFKAISGK